MRKNQGKSPKRMYVQHIVMLYCVVIFPTIIFYFALRLFTDFDDRLLVYSLIPIGSLLCLIYIIYLILPEKFLGLWRKDHGED